MKERAIPLYQHEVRGILDNRQSMFRRVVRPQPNLNRMLPVWRFTDSKTGKVTRCLYGPHGTRLWGKETWRPWDQCDQECGCGELCLCSAAPPTPVCYRADGHVLEVEDREAGLRWHPSIFMPRWASRITLEVTDIRVERLQDISEANALAEGCMTNEEYGYQCGGNPGSWPCPACKGGGLVPGGGLEGYFEVECIECETPVMRFKHLWDSINAKRGMGWDQNPCVWVVQFEVVKP